MKIKHLLSSRDLLFFNNQGCQLARFKQIGHCSLKFKKTIYEKSFTRNVRRSFHGRLQ